jgi:hypothetical protein
MNTMVTNRFIFCHDELKRLRKVRSSRQFALSLDYLPQSLSEILKGRRDVTLELLRKGVEKYEMNPVFLLTGKGNHFSLPEEWIPSKNDVDAPVDSDVIYFVPQYLGEKYAAERRNSQFLASLERLKLPGTHLKGHNFRAFEVQAETSSSTFLPGDIFIAEKLDPAAGVKSISKDKFYVVVTKNKILIHKIDLNSLSKGYVHLYLDNKEEKFTPIKLSEILEFWEVRLKVTRNIENENMTLNALMSEIKDIRKLLFNSSNALVL